MSELVAIRGLHKAFERQPLFRQTDFALEQGQCAVLSGRNGTGKTTLLKILAGFEEPDAGQFYWRGQSGAWRSLRKRLQREVVYLHQQPYMFDRSVAENVAYGLRCHRLPKSQIQQQVDEVLEWAELSHLRERNARYLSGGEKQRVALARARVLSPQLLLLDEPTANMDLEGKEKTFSLLRRLHSEGHTVLITSHELHTIAALGDVRWHLQDAQLEITEGWFFQRAPTGS